jgi:hypothetical protein
MNTPSKAYVTKFSSGTILALLALSGLLFLVPIAVPVFAASNAVLPTFSASPSVVVGGGGGNHSFSLVVTNPISNAYAITSVTVFRPSSSWTLGGTAGAMCVAGGFVTTAHSHTAVQCTGSLSPGFSVTLPLGFVVGPYVACAAGPTFCSATSPISGTFQSTVVDAGSSPGSYVGPTFSMSTIHSATIAVTPAGATAFTAGSAAATVKATLNSSQVGVSVAFTITNGAYPHAGYTASLSPTSGTTDSTGSVTSSFTPSNWATDASTVTATAGPISAASGLFTTGAGAPTTITFTAPATTDYLSGAEHGTPGYVSSGAYGEQASGAITATVSDSFGNAIGGGISANTCVLTAFNGAFDNAGTQSATNSIVGPVAACSAAGAVATTLNYFQSGTYGTTGYVQGTETGMFGGNSFTAQGVSKNFITSTFDAGVSATPTGIPALAGTVAAGKSDALTYQLTIHQAGVPVTFFGINSTNFYAGSFVGGSAPFHKGLVSDPANVTVTTDSTGKAVATFNVDTTTGSMATFKAQVAAPIDGTPTNKLGLSAATGAATTIAGPASVLAITGFFDTSPLSDATTKVVGGSSQVLYIDISLFDAYGNVATNPGPGQIQVNLATTAGALSATTVYINSLGSDTYLGGSGAIVWTLTGTVGTNVTLTAVGVLNGVSTTGTSKFAVVTPNPTLTITSPTATTVFSNLAGVAFSGKVTLSKGYETGDVTLFGVFYKIDSGAWVNAGSSNPFTAVASFANGLHTISFFANDSAKGTSATTMVSVLVDTAAPVITATTTSGSVLTAGTPVVFSVVDPEGDLNATTVKATSNSTSTLTVTVTPSNTLGSSVTYTVMVTGFSTGHWSVTLNAKDLTGNVATPVSVVVVVKVPFAQSVTVSGTPSKTTIGGFTGVSATYTNNWNTAQNLIVFAVWKNSAGQTVAVTTSGLTLAAGASGTAFAPLVSALPSGSYTVNVFVWTTSNQPVSSTTSISVSV